MKIVSLFLIVLCIIASISCHGDHSQDDHSHDDGQVLKLNTDNFAAEVNGHPLTLVEFFAPWCGHCKALAPQFATAATALKGEAVLAAVDCTVEKDLCSQYDVKGFPTLKIFRGNTENPSEYQGGRQSEDIIKFMRKQNEPAFVKLTNQAETDAFLAREGVNVIGFFADEESDDQFVKVAEALRNEYNFAVASDASMVSSIVSGVSAPSVVLFKKEGDKVEGVVFSGDVSSENEISSFINAEAFPLVGTIGPENYQKYLDRGLPLVWFFYDLNNDAQKTDLNELTTVAAEFKGKVSIVRLDGVRWAEHAKHYGVPAGHLPALVAEDREENKNYLFPLDKELTVESMRAHLQGFVTKSLQPTVKTQEPPTDNSAPVKVVVGKTFNEIVMDDTKDVFVEFYAPWCGHCKNLAPKYDQLGLSMQKYPNVVIAKVDATENDTPAKIQGFPTLIFYPAGDKANPIQYEGDRTAEAMEEWIKTHGTTISSSTTGSTTDDHNEL